MATTFVDNAQQSFSAFSAVAMKFAREHTIAVALGAAAVVAGAGTGLVVHHNHETLRDQARSMATAEASSSNAAAVDSFMFASGQRLATASLHADHLAKELGNHKDALSVSENAPQLDDILNDLAQAKSMAQKRMNEDKAALGSVRAALAPDAAIDTIKAGLTPSNIAAYKDLASAARASDPSAQANRYTVEIASVGARAEQALADAIETEAQVEKTAREALAKGWNGWDDAQGAIAKDATASLESSRAATKAQFDTGNGGSSANSEWSRYDQGYNAGIASANAQIQRDRERLHERSHSGGMTFMDWYLLNHWINSANTRTVYVQSSAPVYYQAHPYVAPPAPARTFSTGYASTSAAAPAAKALTASPSPTLPAPSAGVAKATLPAAAAPLQTASAKAPAYALRNPYAAGDPSSHLGAAATDGIASKVPEIKSFEPSASKSAYPSAKTSFNAGKTDGRASSSSSPSSAAPAIKPANNIADRIAAMRAQQAASIAKAKEISAQSAKAPSPAPSPAPSSIFGKPSSGSGSASSKASPSPSPSPVYKSSPSPSPSYKSPSPSPRPSPSPSSSKRR